MLLSPGFPFVYNTNQRPKRYEERVVLNY